MKVYDGATWIAATSAGNVSFLRFRYVATSGQTTFSGSDSNSATLTYTVNNVVVFLNGVSLDQTEYTATSGTSVVLGAGAALNDELVIVAFKSFVTADMVPASTGGTYAGAVRFAAGSASVPSISVDGDTNTGIFFPAADTVAIGTGGTEALRVNSSQNVGIGTSTPASLRATIESNGTQLRIRNSTTRYRSDYTVGATGTTEINSYDDTGAVYTTLRLDGNPLVFNTNGSERARIDSSGNFLVGTTSTLASGYRVSIAPAFSQAGGIAWRNFDTVGTSPFAVFLNSSGTVVGSISVGNSATTYATSSDYRLKENVQPMTGALAKVAALKPCTYTWKADGSAGEGFIAHELAEVVPDAVVGEKDAVNDDGSIKPQGIDTSFLVATLTSAIQEQQAMIDEMKAEIAALKGNA